MCVCVCMYTCVYVYVCIYGERVLLHLLVKVLVTKGWKHYFHVMPHSGETSFFWKRKKKYMEGTNRGEPWNNK